MEAIELRKAVSSGEIEWRKHALEKMAERNITKSTVTDVLGKGVTIEDYPSSKPYPSCLILGFDKERPIHVAAALDSQEGKIFVITAYEPNLDEFGPDFKTRRRVK